jgi:hypothetical protein
LPDCVSAFLMTEIFRRFRVLICATIMQAASSTLDQVKQQLLAAQEAASKQQAAADAAAKRTAARQQQRLSASAQALGTAVGLLLSCMATMAAAAGVLQHSMQSMTQQQLMLDVRGSCSSLPDSGGVGAMVRTAPNTEQAGGQTVQSRLHAKAEATAAAAGLADMVCLSGEELADLLGPNDDTCRMLLLELQQQQQQEAALDQQQQDLACGGSGAAASGVALVQRVKMGGTQALLELEAGEGGSQRLEQLRQQLAEVVSQLSSNSSSGSGSSGTAVVSAAGIGSGALLEAAGAIGGSGGSSVKGGRGAGGGGGSKQGGGNAVCVVHGLQSLLQLLTQDVGAQQGMLRAAVCLCAAACC